MPATGQLEISIVKSSGVTFPITQITSFNGDPVVVETKDLDLGEDAYEKYVDSIQLDISGRGALSYLLVSVGVRNRHNDALRWIGDFSLAGADTIIFPRASARYFRLKIKDQLPLTRWALTKIVFYGSGFDPMQRRGPRGRLR